MLWLSSLIHSGRYADQLQAWRHIDRVIGQSQQAEALHHIINLHDPIGENRCIVSIWNSLDTSVLYMICSCIS